MTRLSDQLLADGAIALWALNETSGTIAADESGAERNATATGAGAVAGGAAGLVGTGGLAFTLNGTDYLKVFDTTGLPSANQPYTFEIWFSVSAVGAAMDVLSYGAWTSGNDSVALRLIDATHIAHVWGGGTLSHAVSSITGAYHRSS